MFRQLDFRSFFRFLGRNRLYTFINIFGLSVSLTFVVLIAVYTVRQLTTDGFQRYADRIYVLGCETDNGSAYRLADRLLPRYPEIEKICSVAPYRQEPVKVSDRTVNAKLLFTDTTFFDLFSFRLKEGDPRRALASREDVVLSESFARKMFGDFNPLGYTIRFLVGDEVRERVVSGVAEDFDNSIIPACDIVLRFENIVDYNQTMVDEHMSNAGSDALFILAKEGADLQAKREDMAAYFKSFYWPYAGGRVKEVRLTPLRELYFDPVSVPGMNHGDWTFVLILLTVGLAILAFAVMNYVNLTVAQAGFRAKEMAARRLLGASRGEIVLKLILESTLLCAVAFAAALCLAEALAPAASRLLQYEFSVWRNLDGTWAAACASLVLVLGVVSGIVPAWIVSRFKPIDIVRGAFRRQSKMRYSRVLITLQNTITIVLVAASLTVMLQIDRLLREPLGYETEDILHVSVWSQFRNYGQISAFRDGLRQFPFVEDVALSMGFPLDGGNNSTVAYGPDRMISFQVIYADSVFFRILGLSPLRDNGLGPEAPYLNRYAFKELDIPEDSEYFRLGADLNRTCPIRGIFEDFQFRSVLSAPTSALIYNLGDFDRSKGEDGTPMFYPWDILVKISGDPVAAYERIRALGCTVTGENLFEAKYVSQEIREMFAQQRRTQHIVLLFTWVAVLISALGLLAVSTYYIQQKQQEIAVRKVFGSTRDEVLARLVGHFMRLVAVAFVLACPVVWWLQTWWLADYRVRIARSPLIILAAGLFAAAVALAAVWWQSRRAADEDPVDSIRN